MELTLEQILKLPHEPLALKKYQSIMLVPRRLPLKESTPGVTEIYLGRQSPVSKFGQIDLIVVAGCNENHEPVSLMGCNEHIAWEFRGLEKADIHSNMHLQTGIIHFYSKTHTFCMDNTIVTSWIIVEKKVE